LKIKAFLKFSLSRALFSKVQLLEAGRRLVRRWERAERLLVKRKKEKVGKAGRWAGVGVSDKVGRRKTP